MNKKKFVRIVILLAAAGTVLALYQHNRGSNRVKYRTVAVTRGDLESLVFTSGTLDPVSVVEVGSQLTGKIAQIDVDFNSLVKKGQVLAELDKAPFEDEVSNNEAGYRLAQASLEKARVSLDNAKKVYDRQLDLFQHNMISADDKDTAEELYNNAKDDVEIAQAGLREAKSELDASRIDLANAVIRSPIDGVVVSRDVNVGQTVTARVEAPVLFKIANDLNKLRVDCDVEEADIGKAKEAQNVRFTVETFPAATFTGRVIQVRYGADTTEEDVTYTVVVEVDNPQAKLLPGMTATIFIITASAKNVLRVPNAALNFEPPSSPGMKKNSSEKTGPDQSAGQKKARVWIQAAGGELTPVMIKTGITDDINTEVIEGDLKEGEIVLAGLEVDNRKN